MGSGKGLQAIGILGEDKFMNQSAPASGENIHNKNHVCVFLWVDKMLNLQVSPDPVDQPARDVDAGHLSFQIKHIDQLKTSFPSLETVRLYQSTSLLPFERCCHETKTCYPGSLLQILDAVSLRFLELDNGCLGVGTQSLLGAGSRWHLLATDSHLNHLVTWVL